MEVNKKQLADIFGASIRTIQNWQEQGMPVLRGGGKGNEVLYDSAAVIKWYAERDAEIENEKLRREVEELRQASETDLQPGTIPGAVHFPNNPDIFDLTEAQQLTAEEQVEKWVDGRKKILWGSKKRRNEALDCFVYALAALRISISRWQLDLSALLASLQEEDGAATNKKTLADYARALSGEDE